jgi:hypothetical protein
MATRLERLGSRRIDPNIKSAKLLNESWRSIAQSESVRYVVGAMQPIDPEYTKNTYAQGERVKNQLQQRLAQACDYEYQGSTTNDTHIKAASDIDLLVLTQQFWTLESPQQPTNPYTGDPVQDLIDLRSAAVTAIREAFPTVSIDVSGAKSISLTGGSLTRDVDVVPANWYDTNQYAANNKEKMYRGVQIVDVKSKERINNTPFLHNAWIQYRDSQTGGGLRKAARLMKSLKYDSESIDLSSYDLVSIAYNMPDAGLVVPKGQELMLLGACVDFVRNVQASQVLQDSIVVPDGHRKVFAAGHATAAGLGQLSSELKRLAADVLSENQRSFKKLAEARVEY